MFSGDFDGIKVAEERISGDMIVGCVEQWNDTNMMDRSRPFVI